MSRTLVTGGTVVTPWGRVRADVLVAGERIAAVAATGALAGAGEPLDATGMLVLPGLVDAHVHVRDPGLTHKEDFASAGRAAVAGGITTIVVMPHDDPVAGSAELLAEKAELGTAATVDFALLGAVGSDNADAVAAMAAAGAVGVEVWLDGSPAAVGPAGPADLRAIMRAAARVSVPVGVWCETPSLAQAEGARLQAGGRRDLAAHGASRPAVGEEIGVAAACALAADTGAALHLRQLSTAGALAAALAARRGGVDVTLEVTPHHLSLAEDDAAGLGARAKVLPPLRSRPDVDALRAALLDGSVDIVASDHAPHAPAEKDAADIWAAAAGLPGLETLLGVLLTELGPAAPEIVARVSAAAPAARFGLAGRKGRIAPGLDADLVLVDLDAEWTVAPGRLHTRAADSPWAGRRLIGRVRDVMRRGELVVAGGEPVAAGAGEWLRPTATRVAVA